MGRVLVVYYSRTGHTRQVAEVIASLTDADTEEILEIAPRRGGFFGNIATSFESLGRKPSNIVATTRDPADYDLVLIGTQVWAGSLTPPTRAYLAARGTSIGRYALFCTLGGMGSERVFGTIAHVVGHPPIATVAIPQHTLSNGGFHMKVESFVAALKSD